MNKLREEFEKETDYQAILLENHRLIPSVYYLEWLESKLEKSPWISCKDQEPPRNKWLIRWIKKERIPVMCIRIDDYPCWSVLGGIQSAKESDFLPYYMEPPAPPKE